MPRGTTTEVGAAWRNGRELQGNGSIRSERRGDLMVGYSYAEPVVITDGRDTLKSIRSWSVTTSSHMNAFGAVGRIYPADTDTLHAVARGDLRAFGQAVERGRLALQATAERNRAKGVPMECVEPGMWQTDNAKVVRDGTRWYLYVDDVQVGDGHPTARAARVAAWDKLGREPSPSFWDVIDTDLRPA